MDAVAIQQQALALSANDRAQLAERLLESLETGQDSNAEQQWLDVAVKRAKEIDQGLVELVSSTELETRVQALLK